MRARADRLTCFTQAHKWFKEVHWTFLREKRIVPPWIPKSMEPGCTPCFLAWKAEPPLPDSEPPPSDEALEYCRIKTPPGYALKIPQLTPRENIPHVSDVPNKCTRSSVVTLDASRQRKRSKLGKTIGDLRLCPLHVRFSTGIGMTMCVSLFSCPFRLTPPPTQISSGRNGWWPDDR